MNMALKIKISREMLGHAEKHVMLVNEKVKRSDSLEETMIVNTGIRRAKHPMHDLVQSQTQKAAQAKSLIKSTRAIDSAMEIHGVRYEYDFTRMFKEKIQDLIGVSPQTQSSKKKKDSLPDRGHSSELGPNTT